jgi:hypothetical protein
MIKLSLDLMYHVTVKVFFLITAILYGVLIYSQNLIIDPGFEVGYTNCYDGIPGLGHDTQNCNYCSSLSCQPIDNDLTFDMESAHWKEGKHTWDKGNNYVDWVKENCSNQYIQGATNAFYYGFVPKQNHIVIASDVQKCKNNNKKYFHDAVRISLPNGMSLKHNTSYIIRLNLYPLRSKNYNGNDCNFTDLDPASLCHEHVRQAHLRVYFAEKGPDWYKNNSDRFLANNAVVYKYIAGPSQWEYVERRFTTPASGTYKNLILYMQSGAFAIDNVELYEECTDYILIQNKDYVNLPGAYIPEAGYFEERTSNYIMAGNAVGAVNVYNGDVIIHPNATVTYEAANRIVLKPGFKASNGSYFRARNVPCSTNRSYFFSDTTDLFTFLNHEFYTDEDEQEDITKMLLEIYPNPANNKVNVNISHENTSKKFILNIINSTGAWCASYNLYSGNNTIDIQKLPLGIYLFYIQNEDNSYFVSKTIVKN